MKTLLLFLILICPVLSVSEPYVPEELQPWIEWVEERDAVKLSCAKSQGANQCVWPTKITYRVFEDKVQFEIDAFLQLEDRLSLPVLNGQKPKGIKVKGKNGEARALRFVDSSTLELPKGYNNIQGYLITQGCSSNLPILSNYGLFQVVSECNSGNYVRRKGELVLEDSDSFDLVDSYDLQVFRRIQDGSPLRIETLLELKVTGRSRSLALGKVTLEGAEAYEISGSLPHYLSPDGSLSLQLNQGNHKISIKSFVSQPVDRLVTPAIADEQWSFKNFDKLRSVELTGARSISAGASRLPENWRDGSLLQLDKGEALEIVTLSRGMGETAPDSISLYRSIWPKINGDGLVVRDQFSGSVKKNFRLDSSEETMLGRVTSGGEQTLITENPQTNNWGIQLTSEAINLEAVSEYKSSSSFPALGWDRKVVRLSGEYHIPPSNMLLTMTGVKQVSNAWLDSWDLLKVFFGVLIVIATFKFCSPLLGYLVGVAIVLNHQEFLAPGYLFTYLVALFAWDQVLTGVFWKRLARALSVITFAALAVQSLSYAKLQITQAFFPQLQAGTRYRTFFQELFIGLESTPLTWPISLFVVALIIGAIYWICRPAKWWQWILKAIASMVVLIFVLSAGLIGSFTSSASYESYSLSENSLPQSRASKVAAEGDYIAKRSMKKRQQVANKLLSQGVALPTWNWRKATFTLEAPVEPSDRVSVYMLGQTTVRALCAMRTVLTLVILVLLASLFKGWFKKPSQLGSSAFILPLLLVFAPNVVRADFPSTALLDELGGKLSTEVCTQKQCSHISEIRLDAGKKEFAMRVEVYSNGDSGVFLPGPLYFSQIEIGGKQAALSFADGFTEVLVPNGRSILTVAGSFKGESAVPLRFKQQTPLFELNSDDWGVEGQRRDGSSGAELRLLPLGQKSGELKRSKLEPLVRVTRNFQVSDALDVYTLVSRTGDTSSVETIKVRRFEEEKLIAGAAVVKGEFFEVRFGVGVSEVSLSSSFGKSDSWKLSAESSELWSVSCDGLYSCAVSGLPSSSLVAGGKPVSSFYPNPGEVLSISAQELSVFPGRLVTVDNVTTTATVRSKQVVVGSSISVRASERTKFNLEVPEDYTIRRVNVSNRSLGVAGQSNAAEIVLEPGAHKVFVEYARSGNIPILFEVPELKFGAEPGNSKISVSIEDKRWVLWLFGPSWGPGALYWAKVLTLVVLILGLVRVNLLPLKSYEAVLLTIGLSFLPTILLWLPFAWLAFLKFGFSDLKRWVDFSSIAKKVLLSIIFFGSLLAVYSLVSSMLLGEPAMLLVGNSSNRFRLNWYVDYGWQAPAVLSLPLFYWRVVALAWCLWFVVKALGWIKETVRLFKHYTVN